MKESDGEAKPVGTQLAEFQLLRAHAEREIRPFAVIMVTSAERGDGNSLTAHSLANSLAQSGRKTALIDAAQIAVGERPKRALEREPEGRPAALLMPRPGPSQLRETVNAYVDMLRGSYEYAIVDAPPLVEDNVAMALAASVDGILISVRVGRKPTSRDRSIMRIIELSGGKVLGVVATLEDAIAQFEANASVEPSTPRPSKRPHRAAKKSTLQSAAPQPGA